MSVQTYRRIAFCLLLCWSWLAAARPETGAAQSTPAQVQSDTRSSLEQRLREIEQGHPDGEIVARQRAELEASQIRARLAEGDLHVGDRVILVVEGEPQLSDTFTVGAAQVLVLPLVGELAVGGVLRDELVPQLTRELSRYVKDPIVTARILVRVGVHGEVARPGYYHVPTDAIVSDVLEAAGGLTKDALLAKSRLMRNGQQIWSGSQVDEAFAAGRTLDHAGIHAGDQLQVARREDGASFYEIARTVAVVLSIPLTIYAIAEIIREE